MWGSNSECTADPTSGTNASRWLLPEQRRQRRWAAGRGVYSSLCKQGGKEEGLEEGSQGMASSPHLKAQDLTHYVTVKPARDGRVLQTTPRTDHLMPSFLPLILLPILQACTRSVRFLFSSI